jgi:hypothetical protein
VGIAQWMADAPSALAPSMRTVRRSWRLTLLCCVSRTFWCVRSSVSFLVWPCAAGEGRVGGVQGRRDRFFQLPAPLPEATTISRRLCFNVVIVSHALPSLCVRAHTTRSRSRSRSLCARAHTIAALTRALALGVFFFSLVSTLRAALVPSPLTFLCSRSCVHHPCAQALLVHAVRAHDRGSLGVESEARTVCLVIVAELVVSAMLATLVVSPAGSFEMRSCGAATIADFYTGLDAPSAPCETADCAYEAVYPMTTWVMVLLLFGLGAVAAIRLPVSRRWCPTLGPPSVRTSLYILPAYAATYIITSGLWYFAFPFVLIVAGVRSPTTICLHHRICSTLFYSVIHCYIRFSRRVRCLTTIY